MRRSEMAKPAIWIALTTVLVGCSDFGGNLGPYDGSAGDFVTPGDVSPEADADSSDASVRDARGEGSAAPTDAGSDSGSDSAPIEGSPGSGPTAPGTGTPPGTGTSGGDSEMPAATPPDTGTPDEAGADAGAGAPDATIDAAGGDASTPGDTGAQETAPPETGGPEGGTDGASDTGALDGGSGDADATATDSGEAGDANAATTDTGSDDANDAETDRGGDAADAHTADSGAADADAAKADAGDLCDPKNAAATTLGCLQQQDKPTSTTATRCSTCVLANSCFDPAFQGGTCESTLGNATLFAGPLPDGKTCAQVFSPLTAPMSETAICLRVLSTIFTSKCAASLQETPCVCGSVDIASCESGTITPNGAAFDLFACDFNTTGVGTINAIRTDFTVQTFGAGQGNALIQCAGAFGCDCF